MTNHDHTNSIGRTATNRRDVLRLGGLGAAAAAILAACGSSEAGELGRVGFGESNPDLGPGTVDLGVLLRTTASVERTIVDAYQRIIDEGLLASAGTAYPDLGDQTALVQLLQQHHVAAAATIDTLTEEAGAEPWPCGNPRFDAVYVGAIMERSLSGQAATDAGPAIEPSDDVARDMMNLVESLEQLSAATCQAMVPQMTTPAQRAALMTIGARSSRQAAHVALVMNPGGYLPGSGGDGDDGSGQTPVPPPVALPSTYGSLSAIVYVGGRGDANGVRQRVSLETPSLNSLAYAESTCAS